MIDFKAVNDDPDAFKKLYKLPQDTHIKTLVDAAVYINSDSQIHLKLKAGSHAVDLYKQKLYKAIIDCLNSPVYIGSEQSSSVLKNVTTSISVLLYNETIGTSDYRFQLIQLNHILTTMQTMDQQNLEAMILKEFDPNYPLVRYQRLLINAKNGLIAEFLDDTKIFLHKMSKSEGYQQSRQIILAWLIKNNENLTDKTLLDEYRGILSQFYDKADIITCIKTMESITQAHPLKLLNFVLNNESSLWPSIRENLKRFYFFFQTDKYKAIEFVEDGKKAVLQKLRNNAIIEQTKLVSRSFDWYFKAYEEYTHAKDCGFAPPPLKDLHIIEQLITKICTASPERLDSIREILQNNIKLQPIFMADVLNLAPKKDAGMLIKNFLSLELSDEVYQNFLSLVEDPEHFLLLYQNIPSKKNHEEFYKKCALAKAKQLYNDAVDKFHTESRQDSSRLFEIANLLNPTAESSAYFNLCQPDGKPDLSKVTSDFYLCKIYPIQVALYLQNYEEAAQLYLENENALSGILLNPPYKNPSLNNIMHQHLINCQDDHKENIVKQKLVDLFEGNDERLKRVLSNSNAFLQFSDIKAMARIIETYKPTFAERFKNHKEAIENNFRPYYLSAYLLEASLSPDQITNNRALILQAMPHILWEKENLIYTGVAPLDNFFDKYVSRVAEHLGQDSPVPAILKQKFYSLYIKTNFKNIDYEDLLNDLDLLPESLQIRILNPLPRDPLTNYLITRAENYRQQNDLLEALRCYESAHKLAGEDYRSPINQLRVQIFKDVLGFTLSEDKRKPYNQYLEHHCDKDLISAVINTNNDKEDMIRALMLIGQRDTPKDFPVEVKQKGKKYIGKNFFKNKKLKLGKAFAEKFTVSVPSSDYQKFFSDFSDANALDYTIEPKIEVSIILKYLDWIRTLSSDSEAYQAAANFLHKVCSRTHLKSEIENAFKSLTSDSMMIPALSDQNTLLGAFGNKFDLYEQKKQFYTQSYNSGAVLFSQGKFDEAKIKFKQAKLVCIPEKLHIVDAYLDLIQHKLGDSADSNPLNIILANVWKERTKLPDLITKLADCYLEKKYYSNYIYCLSMVFGKPKITDEILGEASKEILERLISDHQNLKIFFPCHVYVLKLLEKKCNIDFQKIDSTSIEKYLNSKYLNQLPDWLIEDLKNCHKTASLAKANTLLEKNEEKENPQVPDKAVTTDINKGNVAVPVIVSNPAAQTEQSENFIQESEIPTTILNNSRKADIKNSSRGDSLNVSSENSVTADTVPIKKVTSPATNLSKDKNATTVADFFIKVDALKNEPLVPEAYKTLLEGFKTYKTASIADKRMQEAEKVLHLTTINIKTFKKYAAILNKMNHKAGDEELFPTLTDKRQVVTKFRNANLHIERILDEKKKAIKIIWDDSAKKVKRVTPPVMPEILSNNFLTEYAGMQAMGTLSKEKKEKNAAGSVSLNVSNNTLTNPNSNVSAESSNKILPSITDMTPSNVSNPVVSEKPVASKKNDAAIVTEGQVDTSQQPSAPPTGLMSNPAVSTISAKKAQVLAKADEEYKASIALFAKQFKEIMDKAQNAPSLRQDPSSSYAVKAILELTGLWEEDFFLFALFRSTTSGLNRIWDQAFAIRDVDIINALVNKKQEIPLAGLMAGLQQFTASEIAASEAARVETVRSIQPDVMVIEKNRADIEKFAEEFKAILLEVKKNPSLMLHPSSSSAVKTILEQSGLWEEDFFLFALFRSTASRLGRIWDQAFALTKERIIEALITIEPEINLQDLLAKLQESIAFERDASSTSEGEVLPVKTAEPEPIFYALKSDEDEELILNTNNNQQIQDIQKLFLKLKKKQLSTKYSDPLQSEISQYCDKIEDASHWWKRYLGSDLASMDYAELYSLHEEGEGLLKAAEQKPVVQPVVSSIKSSFFQPKANDLKDEFAIRIKQVKAQLQNYKSMLDAINGKPKEERYAEKNNKIMAEKRIKQLNNLCSVLTEKCAKATGNQLANTVIYWSDGYDYQKVDIKVISNLESHKSQYGDMTKAPVYTDPRQTRQCCTLHCFLKEVDAFIESVKPKEFTATLSYRC